MDNDSNLFLTLGAPTEYLRANYSEYSDLDTNSNIYIEEFSRIRKVLNSLNPEEISHVHFNNPICKHLLLEMFNKKLFPQWMNKILSCKKDKSIKIIET